MPDVTRLALRMDCNGLDLVHPLDRMPKGSFGYLFNARVLSEGRIDGRPGYTNYIDLPDIPNSIRRLNSVGSYALVGGVGSSLYAGPQAAYVQVDTGYSGDPLSLIPFRPDQSPQSWMYVYDANKSAKINGSFTLRDVGVAPPSHAPSIEYGFPADVDVTTGQDATSWTATGDSSAPTTTDRTGGSDTIQNILYNTGTTEWCCINPDTSVTEWMGERMKVVLQFGGEEVAIREIHTPVAAQVPVEIRYDSGTTGLCSIVLEKSPDGLARNSLMQFASDNEIVRILEVIPTPDGVGFSIRCSTLSNHLAGDIMTGLLSWYAFTSAPHVAGETIAASYVKLTHSSAGVGSATNSGAVDAGFATNRPISPADDYLHISFFLENPQNVVNVQLMLCLDPTPNFSFTNPGNCYLFVFDQTDLHIQGASNSSWSEVVVTIAKGTRYGVDLTRTLSDITGVAVQMTSTDACDYGFDWCYLMGTYGPLIQPNSPVGTVYQSRFRDASTGAHSVPGPQTRYELFPLREEIVVIPDTSTQAGVDVCDIYREGGSVTSPLYVGSCPNFPATPRNLLDTLPDDVVLKINQPPDLTAIQPWPLLDTPKRGTVNAVGTSLTWVTGDRFDTDLLNNTAILVNGQVFLTYGQPASDTRIELTQSAGYIASADYEIASPTLARQPLPFVFGPLEGPFAPVIMAIGDPLNGGNLYFSNFNDADSASDANFLELAPPSSALVSGACWNSLVITGNRDTLYLVRYSYLSAVNQGGSNAYQWATIPAPSGMWSRWACCSFPLGVAYLGRDGIYVATDGGAISITDEKLYTLFPHDGKAATPVVFGDSVVLPVDMSLLNYLRLTYCDETLRFCYRDTGGNFNTLIYDIYRKRWFLNNYADDITLHYLVEGTPTGPNTEDILMLSVVATNSVKLAGGDSDNGEDINTIVLTPALDEGDERSQKLYVDSMTMAGGVGTLNMAPAYESAQILAPVTPFTCDGTIQQFIQNIASLSDLTLYKNIGVKFAWTGGPSGPQLYAWEVSGYTQPYLAKRLVTQYLNLSFPGWKSFRRMYPALISNSPVTFTIKTQDGRTFTYTIPSTGGQFRILPQMLNTNIKDLAFLFQIESDTVFAPFLQEFVVETKEWVEPSYIQLAVFRT